MTNYLYDGQIFEAKDEDGNKYRIKILYDEFAENPRKMCDYDSKILVWWGDYLIGDSHESKSPEEWIDELEEKYNCKINAEFHQKLDNLMTANENLFLCKIYVYEHSGIALSRSDFKDPWDSGCAGFAFIDKRNLPECQKNDEYCKKTIDYELQEIESWINGETYMVLTYKQNIIKNTCPHCGEVVSEDIEWEEIDCFGGVYANSDIKDFLNFVPKEIIEIKN